jgi:hypothetical protein
MRLPTAAGIPRPFSISLVELHGSSGRARPQTDTLAPRGGLARPRNGSIALGSRDFIDGQRPGKQIFRRGLSFSHDGANKWDLIPFNWRTSRLIWAQLYAEEMAWITEGRERRIKDRSVAAHRSASQTPHARSYAARNGACAGARAGHECLCLPIEAAPGLPERPGPARSLLQHCVGTRLDMTPTVGALGPDRNILFAGGYTGPADPGDRP